MAKRTSSVKGISGIWEKARKTTANESSGDFVPVDPGSYIMQLVSVEAQTFKEQRKLWWKWCVVEADDEQAIGEICHDFEGIDDDERLIWVQRNLIALGVDLESTEIEDESDLLTVYRDLIEDNCCARVKVTEKDGWVNMRVQKRVEVEEDLLVDPEEAIKGNAGSKSDGDDDPEGEEEETDVDVGNRVTWEDGKRAGKIVGFDDEDNAIIKEDGKRKKATISLDDLELEDSEEDEDKGDGDGDGDEYDFNEGDEVEGTFEGTLYGGTVTAAGSDQVEVDFGDGPEVVNAKECDLQLAGAEEDPEGEGDGDELEKGDAVLIKVRGKERSGEIMSLNKSKGTARVKDNKGNTHTVKIDSIEFDVD